MKRDFFGRSNAKAWAAVAVTAAFFVPLGVFGAPALARSAASASQYEYAGSQYQYKVTLCHHTHSKTHPWVQIRVGAPAARAHLKHHDGDYLGPCQPAAPVTVTAGQGNSGDHGKSGDHGNSGGHGKGHGK